MNNIILSCAHGPVRSYAKLGTKQLLPDSLHHRLWAPVQLVLVYLL